MRIKSVVLLLPILLMGCASDHKSARSNGWNPTVAGRPVELAVMNSVIATDPDLKGQDLHDTKYLVAPDGSGGGYVAMTAAFGGQKSWGAPYTWLYHVRGQNLTKVFRFPFDASSLEPGKTPMMKGDYWAYECLVCDSPEAGYIAKIPVKVFQSSNQWRIAPDLAGRERERWAHEARLVVQSGKTKYGTVPDAVRMERQLDGLFGSNSAPSARAATTPAAQLSQEPRQHTSNRVVNE